MISNYWSIYLTQFYMTFSVTLILIMGPDPLVFLKYIHAYCRTKWTNDLLVCGGSEPVCLIQIVKKNSHERKHFTRRSNLITILKGFKFINFGPLNDVFQTCCSGMDISTYKLKVI